MKRAVLIFAAAILLAATQALASGPSIDGTPTKNAFSTSPFTPTFPTMTGGSDGHGTGDCVFLVMTASSGSLGSLTGCTSAAGWTSMISGQPIAWDSSLRDIWIMSHVYTNGDSFPQCSFTGVTVVTEGVFAATGNNGCQMNPAFNGNVSSTASATMSGPGGTVIATANDLWLMVGASGGSETTYSNFSDTLASILTESNSTSSLVVAGHNAPAGTQPTAQATQSTSRNYAVFEGALEQPPNAPTITGETANSPNSIKITFTTSGATNSYKAECGTVSGAHPIQTEWLPTGGASPITVVMGELEASTSYYCVIIANGGNDGAGASVSSTEFSAVSTNAAQTAIAMTAIARLGPNGSSDYTTGAASKTRSLNYDYITGSPSYWDSGDGRAATVLSNGTIVGTADDNDDTCSACGIITSDFMIESLGLDANYYLASYSVVNQMTSYGGAAQGDEPSSCGYTDGFAWKATAIHAEGSHLFVAAYRFDNNSPFTIGYSTIIRSEDGGATWFNPCDTSGSTTGDAPCAACTTWPNTTTKMGQFLGFVEDPSGRAGAVTNPQDGLDAYTYATFIDNSSNVYLTRIKKELAPGYSGVAGTGWQDATKWEYYTNADSNGDPNDYNNWSTTLANATALWNESGFCPDQLHRIAWIPDFKRYVVTAVSCGTLDVDTSTSIVGPYTQIYSESAALTAVSGTMPFNASPWNTSGGLFRTWQSLMPGSYRVVHSSSPVVVSANLYHAAFAGTQDTGGGPGSGDSQLNLYSALGLMVNFAQADALSGSFGNGGTITPSRAVAVARSGSFADGGNISGTRHLTVARNDSIGTAGSITAARAVSLSRSASFGSGGIVSAARNVAISVSNAISAAGSFIANLITHSNLPTEPPSIFYSPMVSRGVAYSPMTSTAQFYAPMVGQ